MITVHTQVVNVWPDSSWAYSDEMSEMTHMGDDYITIHVPLTSDCEDIDAIAWEAVN